MNTAFVKSYQLLSEFHHQMLPSDAKRLFTSVWNRLRDKNLTQLWFTDSEICNRARIQPERLASAQSQCCRAGLLIIEPGITQNKYLLGDAASSITSRLDIDIAPK
jgi:hypothetical protein